MYNEEVDQALRDEMPHVFPAGGSPTTHLEEAMVLLERFYSWQISRARSRGCSVTIPTENIGGVVDVSSDGGTDLAEVISRCVLTAHRAGAKLKAGAL